MQFSSTIIPKSLYLHWPFCPYKCHFCPFVALASQNQHMQAYHKALVYEIESFGNSCIQKPALETIFMGGGTPSTYPDELLLDTFATLKRLFHFDKQTEVSIELNPGTVRKEQLAIWKAAGINRLSIGVQSLKDQILQKLNRHQKAADVYRLLGLLDGVFENVSIDLILGLPEISSDDWRELIREVVTWPIKHMSIYFLTVHEDTPLYFKVKDKQLQLPCDDTMIDLYYWTIEYISLFGFVQYEISNFARENFQSRHNSMYWQRKPYKAFGLGACSFDGTARFQNEKNLMKYLDSVQKTGQAISFFEELTEKQIHMEKVMLGIRQSKGVLIHDIMEGIHETDRLRLDNQINQLIEQELVEKKEQRLALTPRGLAVENEIALRLSL